MRSALLFATIAISTFAAPIAQTTDSKLNIHGCWRSGSKRNDQVDSRTPTPKSCKISHPRDVEGDEVKLEARGAVRNPGSKREAGAIRGPRDNKRSDEEGEDEGETVEARAIRNQSSKREAGAIRGPGDNKRSNEDDEDVEARAIRNQSSKRNAEAQGRVRGKNTKREEADLEDLELIDEVANKPDPRLNRGSHPRSAESESFSRAGAGRRSAEEESDILGLEQREAEPLSRGSHPPRSAEAEPGFTRPGERRSAKPEPEAAVTGPTSGGAQLCLKGSKWVRC